MKPIAHKGFSILLNNELYWSKAYQSLTLSARNLLWCMVAELKFTGKRGSKKHPFSYTNNGKIAFTEYEWKKQGLGASGTYLNARNQLIEVGFIKITYRGGMARGDMNKYELLFIEGVKRDDKRWKRYPKENWKHEIPKVKDFAVGRGTRFKKKNNTLKNKTLNGTNLPNELYPYGITPLKK
jgi:hypothetical protein